ncbi:hypothetical protein AVEN_116343-1 [Araneus ventricosus]|uniref:Uncharacterized protein n=1 Tax=Araneus ventricosus TaxID=182803 RepID=A0A4Y2LGY9_ARAVE|nr:hypothetical protein AVEN_116343-1 [Araneus ventricosus]
MDKRNCLFVPLNISKAFYLVTYFCDTYLQTDNVRLQWPCGKLLDSRPNSRESLVLKWAGSIFQLEESGSLDSGMLARMSFSPSLQFKIAISVPK